MGQVIVLNGASSSGKSTLAAALQSTWPTPLLHVGFDSVIATWPPNHIVEAGSAGAAGAAFRIAPGEGPPPSWVPEWGEALHGLMRDAHRYWADLAARGWDLVVDHVLFDESVRADAEATLRPALWVAVTCPLDVLVEREAARRDRHVGLASGTAARAHLGVDYDLTVDTSVLSPAEAADRVLAALRA